MYRITLYFPNGAEWSRRIDDYEKLMRLVTSCIENGQAFTFEHVGE